MLTPRSKPGPETRGPQRGARRPGRRQPKARWGGRAASGRVPGCAPAARQTRPCSAAGPVTAAEAPPQPPGGCLPTTTPRRAPGGSPCPPGRGRRAGSDTPVRRAGSAAAPAGPAAATPPPQRGAESFCCQTRTSPSPCGGRSGSCRAQWRCEGETRRPMGGCGGGSPGSRPRGGAGGAPPGEGARPPRPPPRPGAAPPAPRPCHRPAHREAWLRLLRAQGPATGLLSPPSPAPQARGRAGAGRERLAELLAGGSGTRSGPDLVSTPCCSYRARKHPGIPEEGGGAAAAPRLARPPPCRPAAEGPQAAAAVAAALRAAACRSRGRERVSGIGLRPALGPHRALPRAAGRRRTRLWPELPAPRPRARLEASS